jgi:hypothetical protein
MVKRSTLNENEVARHPKTIEVIDVSEEESKGGSLSEELKREIKKGASLQHVSEVKRQEVDLSAEKALLEKLKAEGKLEEE